MTLENKIQQGYRSEGERQVARFLTQLRLPFHYEPDIYLKEGQKRYIWHPDFYLPQYHTVIEYLGVIGDKTYQEMAQRKQRIYTVNHYHYIPIQPEQLANGYQHHIAKAVHNYLTSQLSQYRKATANFYK